MATRFYLVTAAPAVTPASFSSGWTLPGTNGHPISPAVTLGTLRTVKGTEALTTVAFTPDSADHLTNIDVLNRQLVSSEQLAAQTIAAQTVKIQMQCLEANAGNNLFLSWKLLVVGNDGTLKETLLAVRRDPTTEFGTALANRGDSATTTVATVELNDRIVLEVGFGGTPTAAGGTQGHNGSLRFGDDGTDLAENETETGTTFNGWLEFANDLSFVVAAQSPTLRRKMPYPHQLEVPRFNAVQ